jgi:hypothetical protein
MESPTTEKPAVTPSPGCINGHLVVRDSYLCRNWPVRAGEGASTIAVRANSGNNHYSCRWCIRIVLTIDRFGFDVACHVPINQCCCCAAASTEDDNTPAIIILSASLRVTVGHCASQFCSSAALPWAGCDSWSRVPRPFGEPCTETLPKRAPRHYPLPPETER